VLALLLIGLLLFVSTTRSCVSDPRATLVVDDSRIEPHLGWVMVVAPFLLDTASRCRPGFARMLWPVLRKSQRAVWCCCS